MSTYRKALVLAVIALCLVTVVSVGAQQPLTRVGYVNFEATSVGLGIGFSWGSGWLAFNGQNYPIKVDGLSIAAVGISTANAIGTVYNLNNPADIAGTYVAVSSGLAIVGGVQGTLAQNSKGVVIDMVAPQQGVSINLGPNGFTISMK
ncbi:MAG: hypothetical protein ACHQ2F_04410 [Desulfobaccales bacterium]